MNARPRNLPMVLALVGDSTMTRGPLAWGEERGAMGVGREAPSPFAPRFTLFVSFGTRGLRTTTGGGKLACSGVRPIL